MTITIGKNKSFPQGIFTLLDNYHKKSCDNIMSSTRIDELTNTPTEALSPSLSPSSLLSSSASPSSSSTTLSLDTLLYQEFNKIYNPTTTTNNNNSSGNIGIRGSSSNDDISNSSSGGGVNNSSNNNRSFHTKVMKRGSIVTLHNEHLVTKRVVNQDQSYRVVKNCSHIYKQSNSNHDNMIINNSFTITHYSKEVTYSTTSFISTNSMYLTDQLKQILSVTTNNSFLKMIMNNNSNCKDTLVKQTKVDMDKLIGNGIRRNRNDDSGGRGGGYNGGNMGSSSSSSSGDSNSSNNYIVMCINTHDDIDNTNNQKDIIRQLNSNNIIEKIKYEHSHIYRKKINCIDFLDKYMLLLDGCDYFDVIKVISNYRNSANDCIVNRCIHNVDTITTNSRVNTNYDKVSVDVIVNSIDDEDNKNIQDKICDDKHTDYLNKVIELNQQILFSHLANNHLYPWISAKGNT